jgi:hypothetical protein
MNLRCNLWLLPLGAALLLGSSCSSGGPSSSMSQAGSAQEDHAAAGPGGAGGNGAGTAPAEGGASGVVSGHASDPAMGGSNLPPGHPPISAGGPSIAPPPPGSGEGASGLAWELPASWTEETPKNPMRRAQYRVPGSGAGEDGECVVFYFGPGQGGTREGNASRWVDQFTQPDGSSSQGRARIEMKSIEGKEVMFVEVKGTYHSSTMGGLPSEPSPGYALLGAIVEGPDAPWFFKFTGPEKTVDANRDAFQSLIASIHPGT